MLDYQSVIFETPVRRFFALKANVFLRVLEKHRARNPPERTLNADLIGKALKTYKHYKLQDFCHFPHHEIRKHSPVIIVHHLFFSCTARLVWSIVKSLSCSKIVVSWLGKPLSSLQRNRSLHSQPKQSSIIRGKSLQITIHFAWFNPQKHGLVIK